MINFTLSDIEAAYRATGLKPLLGSWAHDDFTKACPLTALCAKRKGLHDVRTTYAIAVYECDIDYAMGQLAQETLGMSRAEVYRFWQSVDGIKHDPLWFDLATPDERHAHEFGRQVRQAIQNAFADLPTDPVD